MNRLDIEPATPTQVGAVIGEFQRLDFTEDDRDERLAISAALLGLDSLGSTTDLTMGQAGQLYRMLLDISDRAELRAAAGIADEDQADEAELEDGGEDQVDALEVFARAFPPVMGEKQLQAAIVKLAENELGLRVFWIPQAARTGIGRTAKTARGWPDLTIGSPRTARMLHREVKSKYGETSAEQQEWLWMLHKDGRDQGIWRPEDWDSGRIQTELKALG